MESFSSLSSDLRPLHGAPIDYVAQSPGDTVSLSVLGTRTAEKRKAKLPDEVNNCKC
jgi:hypothetical protein